MTTFPTARAAPLRSGAWRFLAAFCVAAAVLLPSGSRAGPALVFEARTGEVLHAHLASRRWHPASLTKLMTVFVALEAVRNGRVALDAPVRISKLAASQPLNTMKLPVGHEITLDTALRILLVKSANDVAVAVAETISGTLAGFVAEMNEAAARLGMADTRFVNPHGVHDKGHYTTARDLALLGAALVREFPRHQDLFALASLRVGEQEMKNFNPLLGTFPGADGMKTGYICESGYNIVASATRDGKRVVAVVLGAVNEKQRAAIAAELLEKAFAPGTAIGRLDQFPATKAGGEPVNLRPFACGGRRMPPELASFGLPGPADKRPR